MGTVDTGGLISAGEGKTFPVGESRITIKVRMDDTGEKYEVAESTLPPGFESPSHVHQRMEQVFYVLEGEVDFKLNDVEEGTGQPVVFVHGGFNDLTIWEQQVPAVAQRYRAIAYSRRYAWQNEGIPDGVADEAIAHAEDLAGLLQTLELGPAHLVGHSYGAGICMIAALMLPELARTLVLMEPGMVPSLGMPPRPPELLKLLLTRPRLGKAMIGF